MEIYSKELSRIKDILKDNPAGMTIAEISRTLNVYRKTTAKYLDMLLISGQVEMRPFGPVKIYTPSQRVPISTMLNLSTDFIVVLDRDLRIVQVNDNFLDSMQVEREGLIGQRIQDANLPFSSDPEIMSNIKEALEGKEFTEEISFPVAEEERSVISKLIPTIFVNGSPGVTIILEDNTEMKKAEEALHRWDKIIEALGFMIEHMLKTHDIDKGLQQSLQKLGEATGVSRIYIHLRNAPEDDVQLTNRGYEWAAPGIEPLMDNPQLQNLPYPEPGSPLEELLSSGEMYFWRAGDLSDDLSDNEESDDEETLLARQGTLSAAIAPIFVEKRLWGFIGYEQCEDSREWTSAEIEALKIVAWMIGVMIERKGIGGTGQELGMMRSKSL